MNNQLTNYTDAELWEAFKKGNEPAFDLIFEKHIRVLYNYGHKFTADTEIIEDCVQDLFVELWDKRTKLGATDSIKFYLFKALRLRIIRRLTQDNRLHTEGIQPEAYTFTIHFSHETDMISLQIHEEQRRNINTALNMLSRRQKEAIQLKYYDNLTYAQIAEIMSIGVDSVYKLISGALSTLKKHIRQVHFSLYWSNITLYTLLFFS